MMLTVTAFILLALLISLGLNRLLIRFASALGLMDIPAERRVHTTPIPRAGGIAVWLSFIIAASVLSVVNPGIFAKFQRDWLIPFSVSSLILVTVGILDDRSGVKPLWKLGGQILAAGLFFGLHSSSGSGSIFGAAVPVWMDALIFIGWSVLLINAFNLIDGLDGLCGGLALIALLSLGGISAVNGHTGAMVVLFLMAGSLLGFLYFNRNPARIFLGDTGSMVLGFFIAAAATQSTGRTAIVGVILLPIAVAGVPLLDVLLAIWRRSMRKLIHQWSGRERVGIFEPDKDHLHHRLLATGAGQKKVTRILHGMALILSVLAFLPLIFGERVLGISLVGLLVLVLAGLRHFASVELVNSGSMLHLAVKRPRDNLRFRIAVFAYDCFALLLAGVIAVWVETNRLKSGFEWIAGLRFTVTFAIFGILSLLYVRAYRRSWSRATIRDLVGVQLAIAMAGVLSVSVISIFDHDMAFTTLKTGLLATFFALVLIQIPKCLIELTRELAVDAGHRRRPVRGRQTKGHQVVIYGAGDLGNLFVESLKTSAASYFSRFQVLGYMDDRKPLHGRIIRGFPVIGSLDDLKDIRAKNELHGVIVAISSLTDGKVAEIRILAERLGLELYFWSCHLAPEHQPSQLVDSLPVPLWSAPRAAAAEKNPALSGDLLLHPIQP